MALNRAVEINHGRGFAGHATFRPQAECSRKGFVHRLLGKIEITEQADQSCQDSSRIHAIKRIEQLAYLLSAGSLGHDTLGHQTTLANQLPRINLANAGLMLRGLDAFIGWVVGLTSSVP